MVYVLGILGAFLFGCYIVLCLCAMAADDYKVPTR